MRKSYEENLPTQGLESVETSCLPWREGETSIQGGEATAPGCSAQLPLFDNLIEEFLSPGQVARLFGVSVKTIYRWNALGVLRGQKLGPRLIKFRRTEVLNLLSPNRKGEK